MFVECSFRSLARICSRSGRCRSYSAIMAVPWSSDLGDPPREPLRLLCPCVGTAYDETVCSCPLIVTVHSWPSCQLWVYHIRILFHREKHTLKGLRYAVNKLPTVFNIMYGFNVSMHGWFNGCCEPLQVLAWWDTCCRLDIKIHHIRCRTSFPTRCVLCNGFLVSVYICSRIAAKQNLL
jgi:hypothetical protein